MDSIFDIIIIVSAIYLIYSAYDMKKTGSIEGSILISKDTDLKKAKDIPGYIQYMYAKTMILGVLGIISGALGIYNSYGGNLDMLQYITMVIYFLVIVLYGYFSVKASKKFL